MRSIDRLGLSDAGRAALAATRELPPRRHQLLDGVNEEDSCATR